MSMPLDHEELLRETYRLSQENNRLLRKMRRSAFWSRIITLIFYGALILAPIWFYMTYLNGAVQNLLQEVQKVEGTGQQAQSQLQSFEAAWQQFQSKFGTSASTSTQH